MNNLINNLERSFWTREDEMIKDIEEAGYDILNLSDYEIDVMDVYGSDDNVETYEIVRANDTIAIKG